MGKNIYIRCQEHQRHLWLSNTEKSALAGHRWQTGHSICFAETEILHQSSAWCARLIREVMKIQSIREVLNKEDGARLRTAGFPEIKQIKEQTPAQVGSLSNQTHARAE